MKCSSSASTLRQQNGMGARRRETDTVTVSLVSSGSGEPSAWSRSLGRVSAAASRVQSSYVMQNDPDRPPSPATRDTLLALLRHRPFAFYVGSRVFGRVGQVVQAAAMAWQVYELTGSALPLAFLGVAR